MSKCSALLEKTSRKLRTAASISRSSEFLHAAAQRKNTSIRNYLINIRLSAGLSPLTILILTDPLNTRSPCVCSVLRYQKVAMKISSPISLRMNFLCLIEKNTLPIRLDRKYARQHRFRVPISFTYRFSEKSGRKGNFSFP